MSNHTANEVALFKLSDRCIGVMTYLFLIGIPLTFANVYFATQYGWIWANQWAYGGPDWERCLLAPNTPQLGSNQQFPVSVSSYAGRIFVFIIVSFKMTYTGINDTDMLPYSVFVTFVSCLGVLIYRESSPIQPQPATISTTLITLIKYIEPHMYDAYSNDLPKNQLNPNHPSNCEPAYRFNRWFLITAYATFGLLVCNHVLIVVNTLLNYRYGVRWSLTLNGVWMPVFLSLIAFGGYLTCFIAKEMSAQQALELGAPIFPFRKGEMDIMSLTLMATFGAIGMGTCKGDLEKFKLGAFVAYLNTAISYPVIMGTLYAYKEIMYPLVYQPLAKNYDLWNTEQCVAYSKASNPSYSVFTDEQLAPICKTLPISMIGQLIQFGATHLLIFACIYVVYKNRELYAYNDALTSRKSMVLDDALSYSVHAYGLLDGEENYNDNNDTNEYTITNTPPTKHRSRSVRRPSNIGGRMVRSGSTYRGRNLTRQSISYLASDASVTSSPKRTTDIEEINAQYNRLYSPETDNNNNSNNLEEQNQQDNAQDAITTYSGRLFGQVSDEENQPVISSESH